MKTDKAELQIGNRMVAGEVHYGKDETKITTKWRFDYRDKRERGSILRVGFDNKTAAKEDAERYGVEFL